MNGKAAPLVKLDELKVHFPIRRGVLRRTVGHVRAVDGVSLALNASETVGLVGESGCGKTTLARALVRLLPLTSGTISLDSRDITTFSRKEMRWLRTRMQIMFQDPYSSLNPRLTVYGLLSEGMLEHGLVSDHAEARQRVDELLELVSLSTSYVSRYPHEFSGGQRQRIAIARALSVNPELLVLDEPVSALDVSIQAQILNLLADLQRRLNVAYLFISHNLSVVRFLADRVAVMYLGLVVEEGSNEEIFSRPAHPYSQALISAAPLPSPMLEKQRVQIVLQGDVPSPINPPPGCRFAARCPLYTTLSPSEQELCTMVNPPLLPVAEKEGHRARCHYTQRSLDRAVYVVD
jgi:peptide/nickel transport system ATP-binding protein/oligopeptide transport system ATP-binding protein